MVGNGLDDIWVVENIYVVVTILCPLVVDTSGGEIYAMLELHDV